MAKAMFVLAILFTISQFFQLGSSIQCYTCTTDPKGPDYYADCKDKGVNPKSYTTSGIYCLKNSGPAGTSRNTITSQEAAGMDMGPDSCMNMGAMVMCSCNSDLCNAADKITGLKMAATTLAGFIVVRFLL